MINFFVKLYGLLHNYAAIPYWVLSPLRRLLRCFANLFLPNYLAKKRTRLYKQNTEVIVSLTSFPARINDVWQVVECMLRQTFRPKNIILWLSIEQFPTKDSVPKNLLDRVNEIFQIRLVEGDLRSHKKYYYVSKEYPDSLVLLIDDDIYYPTDMIERLYNVYINNPYSVVCQYGYYIRYNNENQILSYKKWKEVNSESKNPNLFFGSGGGTLFKPSHLFKDLVNIDLAMKLCPKADDIWLNAMTRLANMTICMLKPLLILPIKVHGDNVTLCSENVGGGENDRQLKLLSNYYIDTLGIDPFART